MYGDLTEHLKHYYGAEIVEALLRSDSRELVNKMKSLQLDQYGGQKFARARRGWIIHETKGNFKQTNRTG